MRSDQDISQAMHAHGDAVWRACRMRMGSQADAQDAFQETYLAYATHDDVRFADEEHRKAWLLRVAMTKCVDAFRKNGRLEALDEVQEQATLEPGDQPDAALWEVWDALARLSPNQRSAVWLTVCEGYTAVEAAQMLDVPVNTIYSWVARGKEHLREALG